MESMQSLARFVVFLCKCILSTSKFDGKVWLVVNGETHPLTRYKYNPDNGDLILGSCEEDMMSTRLK